MPDRNTGFVQRTRLIVEPGAISKLPEQVDAFGIKRPALLVDPALASSPQLDHARVLATDGRVFVRPDGEPSFASVATVAGWIASSGADGVITVGGGSTIDTGKLARGLLASGVESLADLPDEIAGALPMVACPTTAGTGAEVGAGAIVYSPLQDDKILIRRQALAADVVLADAELTVGLPPLLTAFTGLDAFAQALMAYAPAGPDAISGQLALQAMRIIWRALPRAVDEPTDHEARSEMMLGSVMSALGMFNAPPVYAGEHVFAEPIGAVLKCHHGHAVAAFLPATAAFNSGPFEDRYAEIARELSIVGPAVAKDMAARAFTDELREFVISLRVPPLGQAIASYDLDELAARCRANEAYALNPRPITTDDARAIIRGGLDGSFVLAEVPLR